MVGLGFDQYVVQGGDIGSSTARILAAEYDNCKGTVSVRVLYDELTKYAAVHMNFCYMTEPQNFDASTLSASDNAILARRDVFLRSGASYSFEQATRPSTLSFALASSPLALLAWFALPCVMTLKH
jgi:hypothetical protein